MLVVEMCIVEEKCRDKRLDKIIFIFIMPHLQEK